MASSPPLLALALAALLALSASFVGAAKSKAIAPAPAAPEPLNVTAILLHNSTNHKTFARLLHETQVDIQINSELDDRSNTFTILAPTDDAFVNLKGGALNTLTQQDLVELVLYHILPRYYSLPMFVTASNPVRTQASGNHGTYTLNVTTDNSLRVNVSTGITQTTIADKVFDDSEQLAVYSLDKVMLPYDQFGPKPPPASPPTKGPKGEAAAAAGETSGAAELGRGMWQSLVTGAGLMAAIAGSLL
ncbi:fasciclin-like arabinogalactan protein 9 [Canna indica]|uniref:Fasciclin-like arabinogalactan protein 9 n=1 Tax=Canna indica TaxID=4628 RepID=A0AAQ3K1B6_9LILI|nr:fasciclin-like arabinogalactan protein 9 [Canna indica]